MYVDEHVLPTLPPTEAIALVHDQLVEYIRGRDPLFLVRRVTGLTRRERVRTTDGAELLPTDNAPAWWFHGVLFDGHRITAESFADFVASTPVHFHDIGRIPTLNGAGWHAAHLRNVKDGSTDWRRWTRQEAARRFLRNVHPLNLFLVPLQDWQRIGGDPKLIGYVAHVYRSRFPRLWAELSVLAGDVVVRPDAGNTELIIESDVGGSSRRIESDLWAYVLGARVAKPLGQLLACAPDAAPRSARIVDGLTVPRFVALADALYNRTRASTLQRWAPGDAARQAAVAWAILEDAVDKTFVGRTGWTGAIALLQTGAGEGLARVRRLDPAMLVTAALRVVDGPYRLAVDEMKSRRG